ncbi:MAG: PTS glucose transporter subunit IIA [Clostridia bacterium]|nr:PTS glucose transporter subunit IIA [Clostridia bacterium]
MKPRAPLSLSARILGFAETVLRPLLPAMLASTLIETATTLAVSFGLMSISGSVYAVLSAAGDAFFYFFPILLAYSLAERIGCSQPLAILTAAILLHPTLSAWLAGKGTDTLRWSIRGTVYSGAILPILLTIPLLKRIERLTERFLPGIVKGLLKPVVILAVCLPITLCVIGPSCTLIGNLIARGFHLLYRRVDWLASLLLSFTMPLLLLLGGKHLPVSADAPDLWRTALFSVSAALFGTAIAFLLRSRDRSHRQISVGAALGTLSGSDALALYGVCLRQGKALLTVSLSASLGGLFGTVSGALSGDDDAAPSILSIAGSIFSGNANGIDGFASDLPALAVTFLSSALLSLLLTLAVLPKSQTISPIRPRRGQTDHDEQGDVNAALKAAPVSITLASPLSGKVIPLSQMDDPAFAAGVMGQGCAILPVLGKVYAPDDGTVTSVAAAGNSLTFETDSGVELLIHIGHAAFQGANQHYFPCCRSGDTVKAGDLLLSFDIDGLRRAGADLATPLLIINAERYGDLSLTCESSVSSGDRLLTLSLKE